MEFINVNVSYVSTPGITTGLKIVNSISNLEENLAALRAEKDLNGIGAYLEAEVSKDGLSFNVKIPFFLASNDELLNLDRKNKVNPLALKMLEDQALRNPGTFDLDAYKTAKTAEINARIAALGATPDPDLLEELNDELDEVTALKKKDTQKILKKEIASLSIKKKLDVSTLTTDADRMAAVQEYINEWKKLFAYKAVLKNLTWSQKRGISKLNNKFFKAGTAIALAAALAVTTVTTKAFGIFNKKNTTSKTKQEVFDNTVRPTATNDSRTISEVMETRSTKTKAPTKKPVVTYTPAPTRKPTATYTPAPTRKPIVIYTPTPEVTKEPKNSLSSEFFDKCYKNNYSKFNYLYSEISKYYNYSDCITAYTIVENLNDLDVSKISASNLKKYITNARALIAFAIESNNYPIDSMREYNYSIVQSCLNGQYDKGIKYVQNASESSEPLVDVITIGQFLEAYMPEVTMFDSEIYYKEIEEYIDKIKSGKYQVSYVEPEIIKTLGTYPNV